MIAFGSTNASKPGDYIFETCSDTESEIDYGSESTGDDDGGEEVFLYEFYKYMSNIDRDPDDILVSAEHSERHQGVKSEHISKVWIIDIDQVKYTLNITTQKSVRVDDPKLSRNYGMNDRMLRYKRININFYMDNLFATKKSGKSMRQNICCRFFVTDKGFVYVVPMKSKSDELKAVKEFAKKLVRQMLS